MPYRIRKTYRRRPRMSAAAMFARRIQSRSLTYVRKRYTKTFVLTAPEGRDRA